MLTLTTERRALLGRIVDKCKPTLLYWMETEVHVYAFSISANILLSFFPFLLVMIGICRSFHWTGAESAIFVALRDYLPDQLGEYVSRNLRAAMWKIGPLQFFSFLLLFFTANGIFEPLEVALNRAWGITTNRSFVRNQIISFGLIFACGALMLTSTILTALNTQMLVQITGNPKVDTLWSLLFYKLAAIPMSILMLFLIYWLLPNRKLPARHVLPAAVIVGMVLEALKYINVLTWPYFSAKLQREYGPFSYPVFIILWGFFASMVILAGAHWTARKIEPEPEL